MTVRLRNVNVYGQMDLPAISATLDPDEEFDVDDVLGANLLEQVGNYEEVE